MEAVSLRPRGSEACRKESISDFIGLDLPEAYGSLCHLSDGWLKKNSTSAPDGDRRYRAIVGYLPTEELALFHG